MKKKMLCTVMVLVVLLSALLPATAFAAKETPVSAAKDAVVRLLMEDEEGVIYTGSAFGVGKSGKAPEYFVTNAHNCLDDNGNLMTKIYILLDSSAVTITKEPKMFEDLFVIGTVKDIKFDYDRMVECDVVNRSSISLYPDVAVLKSVKPISDRITLKLTKSSEDLKEAQTVHALGFPGDMDDIQGGASSMKLVASPGDVNFTTGNVTQKVIEAEGFGKTNVISHTAQIAHGNSGGPLLNEDGAVVGINTYGVSSLESGTDGNYYFSVFIDYAREILDTYDVPYETAGFSLRFDTATIALAAAMIAIAVVAVVLILQFNKRKDNYTKRIIYELLRLQGETGQFAGRRFPLDDQVSIGRAPNNSIVYPTTTPGVSGNHCVVINRNGQIYVKDTSSQGTFLNGTNRLPKDQLVSVKVGDRISLGSEAETFRITYKGGRVG